MAIFRQLPSQPLDRVYNYLTLYPPMLGFALENSRYLAAKYFSSKIASDNGECPSSSI